MRWFAMLMFGVLALAVAGLFFVEDFHGRPILSADKVRSGVASAARHLSALGPDLTDHLPAGTGDGTPAGTLRLYRWRDPSGVWHYAETPPTDRPSEAVEIDPNRNLVPVAAPPAADRPRDRGLTRQPTPGVPDPASVGRLMEDARAVEVMLEQRGRAMEAASRGQR